MGGDDGFSVLVRAGVVGSAATCAALTPLDVARRSMQAAIAARKTPPTLREAIAAASKQGVARGLFRGFTPALAQAVAGPPIWLVVYSWQKRERPAFEAALIAQTVQVIALQPLEFFRTIRQSGALLSTSVGEHLDRCVTDIVYSEGVQSFWRVLPATLGRDLFGMAVFWKCYITMQNGLTSDPTEMSPLHCAGLASICGVTASLASQPLDVVKNRMQAHRMVTSGQDGYRKVKLPKFFETFRYVWSLGGVRGLMTGALPRAVRAATRGVLLGPLFHYAQLVTEDTTKPIRKQFYLPPEPSRTIVHPRSQQAMYVNVK